MCDNSYVSNLIATVMDCSEADDWESAKHEWYVSDCIVDEALSGTCVCGKEGLRYLYSLTNEKTGSVLYPIGSSCIKKFERNDLDDDTSCWQQALRLMDEAARLGRRGIVEIDSGFYSRKLIWFMYEEDVFKPSKYNDGQPYADYLFMLDMFNSKGFTEKQRRKCNTLIKLYVYPWLRELWVKSKRREGNKKAVGQSHVNVG